MEHITEVVTRLVLQLAVILIAAKLAGEVCERYLKIPPVLGELVAGVIIGPFALGGLSLFGFGPLFASPQSPGEGDVLSSQVPISAELYSIAQVASIILLFVVGLETDLRLFLRYAGPGFLIAAGGVIFPFFLGAYATVFFGFADGIGHPVALFMGAIMAATSVGITARVLADMKKIDTPEGVTVLAAAVVDDVLAVIILTVVVGIVATGVVSPFGIAIVGLKALGFWVVLLAAGFFLAKYLTRFLRGLKVAGAGVALMLALAFLASGLAEHMGLALIIGAYSIGLALSGTEVAKRLDEPLKAVYHALVPVFFVVMGMLVDIPAMRAAVFFGVVISILAIVGKVFGCGIPALGGGFNLRGMWRIGFGMLPRGEMALIIAGIGLTRGVIDSEIFGVSVMMTIVTTLLAPLVIVPLFQKGGYGRRRVTEIGRRAP